LEVLCVVNPTERTASKL